MIVVSLQTVAQANSPLAPSLWEWIYITAGILHLAIFLVLLIWISRKIEVNPSTRLLGIIVAFLIPIAGPLVVWIIVRRVLRRNGGRV